MRALRPGLILLVVQLFLVSSVAGKYLYERQTCPRLWTRATQFDPNLPLRGRYLALQLVLDSCDLPHDKAHMLQQYSPGGETWQWRVSLSVVKGKLVPNLAETPGAPGSTETLSLFANTPCKRATLSTETMLFIPDRARSPFPLKPGQNLWVEVTVPPSGPPRPIQIAISDANGFRPLKFD
jgi:hypothetical protein